MRITNVAHGQKSDKLQIKAISSANYKIQSLLETACRKGRKKSVNPKINTNKSSLLLSTNDE